MSEMPIEQLSEPQAVRFGRTDTMTHAVPLVECPHLIGKAWHSANVEEQATLPVCTWSRDQLEGHGRSHPMTLEDAMREQGTSADVVPLIKEALKFVSYDEIWLPYSKSYVALGLDGRAVASFGKSYVQIGERRVELPGYVAGRDLGHGEGPSYGETCPTCHLAMPLTGICDGCN